MDKTLATTVIVIAIVAMLGSMWLSWWARKKRQSGYAQLVPVPTELGAVFGEFAGLYLATTPTGEPLDRVAVQGLGFRSRTTVTVAAEGLVFAGDRFIPAAVIHEVGKASWTIDRGVSKDGLSVVSWALGDLQLDSYFRLDDQEGFLRAASALIQTGQK